MLLLVGAILAGSILVALGAARIGVPSLVAFLVLGKASALGGALVAGGYLGYALSFVGRFDADGPRERVIRSLVAVVGGAALMAAGLLLERACKVPFDEDEERERRRLAEE